jgi:hypothetical protein
VRSGTGLSRLLDGKRFLKNTSIYKFSGKYAQNVIFKPFGNKHFVLKNALRFIMEWDTAINLLGNVPGKK